MTTSLFDLFKIGVGPSGSHTVGPMVAARCFIPWLEEQQLLLRAGHIEVDLHGSLALNGRGGRQIFHSNALSFTARDEADEILTKRIYFFHRRGFAGHGRAIRPFHGKNDDGRGESD